MNKQHIKALAEREVTKPDFEKPHATLATFTNIGDLVDITEQASDGDIYRLLMLATNDAKQFGMCDGIVLRTSGWAAPVTEDDDEDDVIPSVHPKRRRVHLVIAAPVKTDYLISALRFGDSDEVIIQDTKHGANGTLADAVGVFMNELNRVQSEA